MADAPVEMKPTLGLTGLTMNAMALIAPGAFLWLTYAGQAAAGNTAPAMWAGILFATALCLATAVCYAEMAKLYPGTGSSYYFAEQSKPTSEKLASFPQTQKTPSSEAVEPIPAVRIEPEIAVPNDSPQKRDAA